MRGLLACTRLVSPTKSSPALASGCAESTTRGSCLTWCRRTIPPYSSSMTPWASSTRWKSEAEPTVAWPAAARGPSPVPAVAEDCRGRAGNEHQDHEEDGAESRLHPAPRWHHQALLSAGERGRGKGRSRVRRPGHRMVCAASPLPATPSDDGWMGSMVRFPSDRDRCGSLEYRSFHG